MKLHSAIKKDNEKKEEERTIHTQPVATVHTYEEMKTIIESFMLKYGQKSILVSIVFNGHGKKKGMRFHAGSPVPLDTVIEYIKNVAGKVRSDVGLPSKVELVFGQCYAHLHTRRPAEERDLILYFFTSEENPRTWETRSFHPKLETHAEGQHPDWKDAEKEHATRNNRDPSSSVASGGIAEDVSNSLTHEEPTQSPQASMEATGQGSNDDQSSVDDTVDKISNLQL